MFSLLVVATSSLSFSLLHSLKCFLDLFYKLPTCFLSQATSVLISQPCTQVRALEGCQNTLRFRESFLSRASRNPSIPLLLWIKQVLLQGITSSFGKQLVFVHLPGWNQMLWPTLRAAQLVVCILHPCGAWLLLVPAISSPNSLPGKGCMTGKHWHTVHGKGIITNVQGVSESFPLRSVVSLCFLPSSSRFSLKEGSSFP